MNAAVASDLAAQVRPGVLSLSIKEKSALFAAFMPFIKGGGLFIPTNKSYEMGEEVIMLLTLMDDPAKLPVSGASSRCPSTRCSGTRAPTPGRSSAGRATSRRSPRRRPTSTTTSTTRRRT